MENLRPHHVVCLTKLYSALSLFSQDEELYFNCVKKELEVMGNLRKEILDYCKVTWGIIYNKEVMQILVKVIKDDVFNVYENSCDSICSQCYGNVEGKCVDEERIQNMDKAASSILNLQTNTYTNISSKKPIKDFDKVCNMCGTKDKCNLIRRAVEKNKYQ